MSTDTKDITLPAPATEKPTTVLVDEARDAFVKKMEETRQNNIQRFETMLLQHNKDRAALAAKKGTNVTEFNIKGFPVVAVNEKLAKKRLGGLMRRCGLVLNVAAK